MSSAEQEAYEELQCYTLALRDHAFVHQHVVDAWAAQHADEGTKPAPGKAGNSLADDVLVIGRSMTAKVRGPF